MKTTDAATPELPELRELISMLEEQIKANNNNQMLIEWNSPETPKRLLAALASQQGADTVGSGVDEQSALIASQARMLQAYPTLSRFFEKYAIGSKAEQSCLMCGHVGERAITHIELVDIYICKRCVDHAGIPASASTSADTPAARVPTCDVGHAHFTPFYLLSNCRRICAAEYRRKPNWVLAEELFAVGSTTAKRICRDAGIDPDALEVIRAAAPDQTDGGKP